MSKPEYGFAEQATEDLNTRWSQLQELQQRQLGPKRRIEVARELTHLFFEIEERTHVTESK